MEGDEAVWAAWEAAIAPAPVVAPLAATPALLPDPAAIAPREWLYGTRLIRRFVSVLVAPGGVGKSALALGIAASVATGRGLLGERVHAAAPAWVINLEDPLEELDRRLAALLLHHGLARETVAGRLFLHSGRERRLSMGQGGPGGELRHPDREAVIAAALAAGIGLIVVDPFVKSHGLDENSNAHMDAAATAWAEIAQATGAAVLLVHHVRKGSAAGPDIDAARGGKALTDAARSAWMLTPMGETEAEQLGVPRGERWRHVRLDDAKSNMAAQAGAQGAGGPEGARWFRLETVALGNGNDAYPNGDSVAAIARWRPTSVWQRISAEGCNRALDLIGLGPDGTGRGRFAASRRGQTGQRWAGHVLMEVLRLGDAQAAQVLAAWLREGVLIEAPFRCEVQRKTRLGVMVVEARRPTGDWSLNRGNIA